MEQKRARGRETPTDQKKRLDQEAIQRKKLRDQEVAERQRRQTEEEEAQRRRLEIEAKADEEKRLAELRLAAEQRRLDAEQAERNRLADEAAEERKLRRREEADVRKRLNDEAERLARKARKDKEAVARAEALKPKPLIDVNDRSIPAITRAILAYDSYRTWSAWLIEAFRLIRTGTSTEQAQKRAELPHMRNLIRSMQASNDRMEIQAGYHLERLLEVLEAGRDQHRGSAWFQANYVTGTYADAG